MTVRLTVLGSAGTHPGPGRACSSYLLTAGTTRVLLDCGNGSLANLQQVCDVADVDAVLLSHLHPDHFVDLYGLYYALRFHPTGQQQVRCLGPAGARERVGRLLSDEAASTFDLVCPFEEVAAGQRVIVGPITLELFPANHPVETLAVRATAGDAVVAYSADSHVSDDIVACARDADLFLCDASWLERQRPLPEGVHMTGAEAGATAAKAAVRRLVVTHVVSPTDPDETAAEAAGVHDGVVVPARDLQEHVL